MLDCLETFVSFGEESITCQGQPSNGVVDEDEMIICHERGAKKKSESSTGIEPMASQIPAGRSDH